MTAALDKAEAALRAGKISEARSVLEEALAGSLPQADRAEALSMLGMAHLSAGNAAEALDPLEQAVLLEPDEGMFRYNLAMGLERSGRIGQALEHHREAVRLSGGMPQLVVALVRALIKAGVFAEAAERIAPIAGAANAPLPVRRLHVEALRGTGDLHAAWTAVQRLIPSDLSQATPAERNVALLAARIASDAQYLDEAESISRALVQADSADGDAATVLAPLVLWSRGPEAASEIIENALDQGAATPELLVQLLGFGKDVRSGVLSDAEALAADERVHPYHRSQLLMALAQWHERQGDAEAAWNHASRGNALAPKGPKRDWRKILGLQVDMFSNTAPTDGEPLHPQHLYLCGAPRSGQSLVQSIMAASPEVASLGERGALLPHLLDKTENLAAMAVEERQTLFRQLSAADRKGIARSVGACGWVVDKNPAQIVVAGSIARIHPSARFAVNLRDPADIATSIFLRGFSPFYDYATDLDAIVDHLELIADAATAWREAGLEIEAFSHEKLVAGAGQEAAALYRWLGIAWDESYLDPESRKTPVPTFSAAQVREPIRSGITRGSAPYAEHLAPFESQLDRIREKQRLLLSRT